MVDNISDTISDNDSNSNPYLSYNQKYIRSLLKKKREQCARSANKFFINESKFKKLNLGWTAVSITLSFTSGVFGIANGIWGDDNSQNSLIFISAIMSLFASTITAIINAYGWEGKAIESQLASVMYSKTHTDIILALAAEQLSDAILMGITKDLEYICQMTPNIPEKFLLEEGCRCISPKLQPLTNIVTPDKKEKNIIPLYKPNTYYENA